MSKRSVVAVSGMWLLTVAAASALTWGVISSAGARVGQPAAVPLPTPVVTVTASNNPGSWTGPGGKVVARCVGNSISLVTATPAVGFSVEVKDPGPEELSVEFERGESERESRVRAVCVDGAPVFTRD